MGLNFNTLVQAALLGTAGYQGGKRAGRAQKTQLDRQLELDRRAEELRQSQMSENRSQTTAADALAAQRRDEIDHPEKYGHHAPAAPEYEAKTSYYDSLIAQGKTPDEAKVMLRNRFGMTTDDPPREQGPVRGTPEYLRSVSQEAEIHAAAAERHRKPDAASTDPAKDRREFMQQRITKHLDDGMSSAAAQAAAEREYLGAQYSASHVTKPTTADLLTKTATSPGPDAGKRGARPVVSSSTPKANPRESTSPKKGALRPASDADIDAAIDAVGSDPAKVRKWLAEHNLSG